MHDAIELLTIVAQECNLGQYLPEQQGGKRLGETLARTKLLYVTCKRLRERASSLNQKSFEEIRSKLREERSKAFEDFQFLATCNKIAGWPEAEVCELIRDLLLVTYRMEWDARENWEKAQLESMPEDEAPARHLAITMRWLQTDVFGVGFLVDAAEQRLSLRA